MQQATLTLDRDFVVSEVDPRLFGGFVEHLGRHIYTGIYEPEHPTADEHGFRQDVVELVRELRMPIMRYPGGNFVSGYRWEDGVGPRERRPKRLDLAWGGLEPNLIGTNEFADWCKQVGSVPMLAVNLGTRGPEEAQALVEYCNHPGGTYYSDLRREHGYLEPHGIKVWCLGNEMDGPWQMVQKTAWEYGRLANESAKLMKWTDPTIETVLCGSSGRTMKTFGSWEWESLQQAYETTDYLSLHTYYGNTTDDTAAFLAKPEEMGDFIREGIALCDAVRALKRSKKFVHLSFDEWNVWRQTRDLVTPGEKWTAGRPQLEQQYNMEDALVVGGMLITLLTHADRVRIGCIAQVVNAIAPIMTEPAGRIWKQPTYHPFLAASHLGRGTVLQSLVHAPGYECSHRDDVPVVQLASVADEYGLTVFAVNREPNGQPVRLSAALRRFDRIRTARHQVLTHADLKATNSADEPEKVAPRMVDAPTLEGDGFTAELPPYSWNVLRFEH
ncbi:MAG: alpha-N-arabinofuranosidase [Armatimonadota bacterium]